MTAYLQGSEVYHTARLCLCGFGTGGVEFLGAFWWSLSRAFRWGVVEIEEVTVL